MSKAKDHDLTVGSPFKLIIAFFYVMHRPERDIFR